MAGNKNSGRPEFAPTDEDREKVRVLKAGGMTNEAIAEVIGVSEPTLRKHFSYELDIAVSRCHGRECAGSEQDDRAGFGQRCAAESLA